MPLSDFATPLDWGKDLDVRWPERETLRTLLVDAIIEACKQNPSARVLELGVGDARLLGAVRDALPQAELVGFDLEPVLIDHARASVERCELHVHDLNHAGWLSLVDSVDVAFSMQTFHDLGGVEQLRTIYARLHLILAPGGRLLNADFVKPQASDDPANPRRFAVDVHERILQDIGFSRVECLACVQDLACISARKAEL